MGLSGVVFILCLAAYCAQEGLCVRCLHCHDLFSHLDCDLVTECNATQQCVVQQFVTLSGRVLYTSGCSSSNKCSNTRPVPASSLITCSECCDTDFCNIEGCGVKSLISQKGPKCFNCQNMKRPDDCTSIMQCETDQTCGLIHTGDAWNARCVGKLQCVALSSISTFHSECPVCCSGDLCNYKCTNNTIPTIPPTSIYEGVHCLECSEVDHPFDCNTMRTCVSDDRCYVSQYITPGGLIKYKSGCVPKQRCEMTKRLSRAYGDLDIVTCMECCSGRMCNIEGCGVKPNVLIMRGPKCFSCSAQASPNSCRHTLNCDKGEYCSITKHPTEQDVWKSGCERKLHCDVLSSLEPSFRCCNDDFCNYGYHGIAPDIKTATTAHTTTADSNVRRSPNNGCESHQGYQFVPEGNICCRIYHQNKTWYDAQQICNGDSGTLAIIDTSLKWLALKEKLIHEAAGLDFLIGGYDIFRNDTFYWPNGHKVSFTDWQSSQPVGGAENCIYVNRDEMKWYKGKCSRLFPFICTIDI